MLLQRPGGAGQVITCLQLVAVLAADFFAYNGRRTAKAWRDIETAANGEIGARAAGGKADFELVALADIVAAPLLDGFAI